MNIVKHMRMIPLVGGFFSRFARLFCPRLESDWSMGAEAPPIHKMLAAASCDRGKKKPARERNFYYTEVKLRVTNA